jgi:hypothetical protein
MDFLFVLESHRWKWLGRRWSIYRITRTKTRRRHQSCSIAVLSPAARLREPMASGDCRKDDDRIVRRASDRREPAASARRRRSGTCAHARRSSPEHADENLRLADFPRRRIGDGDPLARIIHERLFAGDMVRASPASAAFRTCEAGPQPRQMSQLSHAQFPIRRHPHSSSSIDGRGVPRLVIRAEQMGRAFNGSVGRLQIGIGGRGVAEAKPPRAVV